MNNYGIKDFSFEKKAALRFGAITLSKDDFIRLLAERDAAIADLENAKPCIACKHLGFGLEHCKHCFSDNCFEWCGVHEVQNNG